MQLAAPTLVISLLTSSLAWTSLARAELPPYAESLRRLNTVLEHPEIRKRLTSTGSIEELIRTAKGYWIKTENCQLLVEVSCKPGSGTDPQELCPLEILIPTTGCLN